MKPIAYKRHGRSWRGLSVRNVGTTAFVIVLAACAGYANLPNGTDSGSTGGAELSVGK